MTYGMWLAWCRLLYVHCKEHKQFKNSKHWGQVWWLWGSPPIWLMACDSPAVTFHVCHLYVMYTFIAIWNSATPCKEHKQFKIWWLWGSPPLWLMCRDLPAVTWLSLAPPFANFGLFSLNDNSCRLPIEYFPTLNFLMIALWAVETFDILAADDVAVGLVGPLLSHGRENQSSFD